VLAAVTYTPTRARADEKGTNSRLLRFPDIHGNRVVFTYAGDIWTAERSGGTARRLTSSPGEEEFAKFSPDGRWIAFTAEYDGNVDVYVMPSEGGEPRRLTYHPAANLVLGWTPDSKRILFRSSSASFSQRFQRLFTISIDGGLPEELPVPEGGLTSFSPDGTKIAYNRISTEFRTWKRYRGGWHQFVSIYDLKNNTYSEVPHTLAADMFPMWSGNAVYFDSDRDGIMNLYKYDLDSKQTKEITHYTEYDVKWPSLGGGDDPAIIYENGGYLYTLDLKTEQATQIPVTVESDDTWARPHYVNVQNDIISFGLSPSGARAVFGARGDVFTVPAKKGDIRNLTPDSSGSRELWPDWSPDGKSIAYFSDKTGEYELYTKSQDGTGEEKRITTDAHIFRFGTMWSPDSTKILFAEDTFSLYYIAVAGGKPVKIDQSTVGRIGNYRWSPDSKWVVYEKNVDNGFGQIFLYSIDQNKSFPVTDGMTNDRSPAFDQNGKYLYFLSDRNFKPALGGFELDLTFNNTAEICVVTLAADTPSPFAPESDEEKGTPAKPAADAGSAEKPGADHPDAAPDKKPDATADQKGDSSTKTGQEGKEQQAPKPIKIDLENIGRRIVKVPVPAGNYGSLKSGKDRFFYMEFPPAGTQGPPATKLHTYDLEKREDSVLLAQTADYDINPAGTKVIYQGSAQPVYGIIDVKPGQKVGDGSLNLTGMEVRLDPRAEWKQIFNEAWRTERDHYYDPSMRGLDWGAIKQKYAQELPYVADRSDLNYLIGEMIAELSTSHSYVGGGDQPQVKRVGVGLLGADFEIANGYYRFKKIYPGDNTDDATRSPLTEPGVVVHEGDYLLAIAGRTLKAGDNVFALLEDTVGKEVSLRVNNKPSEEGARTIAVKPIGSESALRYLDWVETNRRKVLEATGGRCGYIHVPDTAFDGMEQFGKYFYAQTDKDALIVDERFNSGGFIPDFFTERLNRKVLGYVAPRQGIDGKVPQASIAGPKVMLINEYAGSGGDAFPYYFREMGIGLLIGKRTWGGLVGINGVLPNVDGGFVTAPEAAFWRYENGKSDWIVENQGVSPDIDIDNRPDEVVSGHDPQLEKAIEVIKEALEKNPPLHPHRPSYGPMPLTRQ
ncbi:MAG TPA: PDZ domain-containing protein, partial [Blastocatellia bacterium]|nr:PDZ domain-containing protein [Blastocatellia bacterium]